jgi:hypothetical protein
MIEQEGEVGNWAKVQLWYRDIGRLRSRDGLGVMLPRNRTVGCRWDPGRCGKLRYLSVESDCNV